MKYSLSKKSTGKSGIKDVFEFETPAPIKDFQYCGKFNFVFLSENSLGQITLEGMVFYPWFEGFVEPSSICYHPQEQNCLVVEDGGRTISTINLDVLVSVEILKGVSVKKNLLHYFRNVPRDKDTKTSVVLAGNGTICWTTNCISRCFSYRQEMLEVLVGDGRAGYSLATNAAYCHLNQPEGLAVYNGALYICDTGNSCIRRIKDGSISLVAGKPLVMGNQDGVLGVNLFNAPSKIRIVKKTAYILDKGIVRVLSFATKEVSTITGVENATEITIGPEGDVYFLKEIV